MRLARLRGFSAARAPPAAAAPPRRRAAAAAPAAADAGRLSEEYTATMTAAMGAVLTYRHDAGTNFTRVADGLIVGSCLQTPADVDRVAADEGVRTVLNLQEASDCEYFSLDTAPVAARAAERGVAHLRHAVRDFDPHSLRRRLPGAVALLARTVEKQGGAAYVHCTAGLGRAPAVALAYLWWVRSVPLDEAHAALTAARPCSPKLAAIREAAVDLLYAPPAPTRVTLALARRGAAARVEVAGLDVGWGRRLPLEPLSARSTGRLAVSRELPPGAYQYKFVFDGALWAVSPEHPTVVDGDAVNNVVVVPDAEDGREAAAARARLRAPGGLATPAELGALRARLAALAPRADETAAP
jgi:hypothetical protein